MYKLPSTSSCERGRCYLIAPSLSVSNFCFHCCSLTASSPPLTLATRCDCPSLHRHCQFRRCRLHGRLFRFCVSLSSTLLFRSPKARPLHSGDPRELKSQVAFDSFFFQRKEKSPALLLFVDERKRRLNACTCAWTLRDTRRHTLTRTHTRLGRVIFFLSFPQSHRKKWHTHARVR